MSIPFWEAAYKEDDVFDFGVEPNKSLLEFQHLFDKSWNILDVGCGDGKNSLYLAGAGYPNVDAFDISENGISKLRRIAERKNIKINAWTQDLCSFSFSKQYNLIMTFGTLHFVIKRCWHDFIIDAKKNTNPGGIHIIQLFTNKVPASPDIEEFAVGLADENEIEELYSDWHIHQFISHIFEDEHLNVPKHLHASSKIIAQRIK